MAHNRLFDGSVLQGDRKDASGEVRGNHFGALGVNTDNSAGGGESLVAASGESRETDLEDWIQSQILQLYGGNGCA